MHDSFWQEGEQISETCLPLIGRVNEEMNRIQAKAAALRRMFEECRSSYTELMLFRVRLVALSSQFVNQVVASHNEAEERVQKDALERDLAKLEPLPDPAIPF